MHRTQILLEEWQYVALKSGAEQRGLSLSQFLRDIVSAHLAPQSKPKSRSGLDEIEGIGADPGAVARDHDTLLYRQTKKRGR